MRHFIKSLHEEYRMYNIDIILPSDPGTGEDKLSTRVLAVSEYHAIEKQLTKFREIQPDRTKYKYIKSLTSNVRVR